MSFRCLVQCMHVVYRSVPFPGRHGVANSIVKVALSRGHGLFDGNAFGQFRSNGGREGAASSMGVFRINALCFKQSKRIPAAIIQNIYGRAFEMSSFYDHSVCAHGVDLLRGDLHALQVRDGQSGQYLGFIHVGRYNGGQWD